MLSENYGNITERADSEDSDNACCPDMNFVSIRPAPFYLFGYTHEEIKRDYAPDMNRDNYKFKRRGQGRK